MKSLKRLEGQRTYILLVIILLVVTVYVGLILHRALSLPDEAFVDALPGVGDMIGEFGFLLLSGLLGYAGSKGGSALKSWSYWSNMGRERYRKNDQYDQYQMGGIGLYGGNYEHQNDDYYRHSGDFGTEPFEFPNQRPEGRPETGEGSEYGVPSPD